jgi:acyl-CoA synthetase (AMP-forming)/AMP-acid ligase II
MPKRIGDALAWHAHNTPAKVAVIDRDRSLTYAQMWKRVCQLANALQRQNVQPGDRVAILMMNSAAYVELYQAIALLGASAVPLNYRFVGREIEFIVNHSQAKALVLDPLYCDIISALRPQLPSLADALFVTGEGAPGAGWLSYEGEIAKASAEPPAVEADPDTCFFQGYTAGTTGQPKGCVNPHRGFVDFFKRLTWFYGIGPEDVEVTPAPLFHEAPTLYTMMQIFVGGTVVVVADPQPANILDLIARHRVTWGFMVPTMWDSIVNSEAIKTADVSSMRVLVSAGAPLLSHTKEQLLERFRGAGLNEFYGGTEVGVVTNLGPKDQRQKMRSVGKPIIGFDVKLLDEQRNEVPQGEVGEIFISGPILIREYYRNPEADKAARHGNYFSLGDVGRFDEEGFLYIVDRKKDMIITGGENVFPAEIERVLHLHPAVAMTAVVGIPDDRWGETILAAVVAKDGAQVKADELESHCRQHLANFKVPRRFEFMQQLPVSSFGKILRREVRDPYWKNQAVKV